MEYSNLPPMDEDEFSTPVMIYTSSGIGWGDMIVRKPFRPSTWLRSNTYSDSLSLYNAKFVRLLMCQSPSPEPCTQLILPIDQVCAFHVLPPVKEPLDYDPNEPNLRFEQAHIITGMYQISGKIRLPINASLMKYLKDTREQYTSVYDAVVSCPGLSKSGEIRTPFILVRKQASIFIDIPKS